METDIIIHFETDDENVIKDLIEALERLVPYMVDNVVITSEPHKDN